MPETIAAEIERQVAGWAGVTVSPHRFGGVEFKLGRRELGHLHGNQWADLPFPVRIREKLVAEGKASLHYLHPRTGWVSCYIRNEDDVDVIVELFRLNHGRPWLAQ